jgi:hypothetical protein
MIQVAATLLAFAVGAWAFRVTERRTHA